jgi:hypothetical protein
MSRLQLAINQIKFAREYTNTFLELIPPAEWFRPTTGGISHIGWQVGHLAVGQYRLALWRIRGTRPDDDRLLPNEFVLLFGYNSTPRFDPSHYPEPAAIRSVFDRIHEQVLKEVGELKEDELDLPVPNPNEFAQTRIQALLWCANHEMLHAGQIGLLRRELGYAPDST